MAVIITGLTATGEAQPANDLQRIYNQQPAPLGSTRNPHLESYLNPVRVDYGVTPRDVVNSVAEPAEARQATLAAENAPLRVIYGRQRVGAQIATAIVYQGDLILLCVWGQGEIDSVESIQVDDKTPAAGVTFTHYTGTAGQTADSLLIAAYAAQSPAITYADTLPNIAYTVARIPAGTSSGFPRITGIIKGRKVYDPRSTLTVWSDNPALCLANFITNTVYGLGKSVDWNTVTTVANFNDALVGVSPNQEKHRTLNLVVDAVAPIQNWISTLQLYAGCFLTPEGNTYKLLANTTAESVFSFTAANIKQDSLKLKKRGVLQIPTVMEIIYTDTSVTPWKDGSAIAYADGVLAGTTPRRESRVNLPGITRYTQAYREAVERMNLLTLNDLTCSFTAFDDALAVQKGDVVTITHPIGLSNKLMRVMNIVDQGSGRWGVDCEEYDPAAYSTAVVGTPTFADTNLPSPASPPLVLGLALSEEVYQLENGNYASRVRANWTAAVYPFLRHYRCELFESNALVDAANANGTTYASPAIQENKTYEFRVYTVSSLGVSSPVSSSTIVAQGKTLIPGDVPSFDGFEVGGEVHLWWSPAVDIDGWRYEVRYGVTTGSWESATVIDRVDALRLVTRGLAAGVWRFYVKLIDSIRQYSANAKFKDITITLDSDAYLIDNHAFTTPVLTNMTEYKLRSATSFDIKYYATNFGDGFGFGATDTNNNTGTFNDALVNTRLPDPHTAGTSTMLTEAFDFGQSLTGNWTISANVETISGTINYYVELSPDGTAWTQYAGQSVKNTGRWCRIRIDTTGSMIITGVPTIRLDAVGRTETGGPVTSNASGATTISLAGKYAKALKINVQPRGTVAMTATVDAVTLSATGGNSFAVYIFNSAGAQIAASFTWEFEGI